MKKKKEARILFIDIETAPMVANVWGLFDQNISLNQIKSDWHLLSFAAKWSNEPKIIYADQRNKKNIEDDRELLKKAWKLLDEADIVVGQNSKAFDIKKLNARFITHGMQPPSSFKQIDTLRIAKKHFAFTSNKLEYMTHKLNKKYKKLNNRKFNGFELWRECLAGNSAAWKEMEKYNKYDVLSLEELYHKLLPWEPTVNFSAYSDGSTCNCGSKQFKRNGYIHTETAKYQRMRCVSCGAERRGTENLLSPEKKKLVARLTKR